MTPLYVTYEPGGRSAEYASHEGEEFIYILEGTIKLELEGLDPIVLNPGDSAYYRGDQNHAHVNVGDVRASFCGAVSPPHGRYLQTLRTVPTQDKDRPADDDLQLVVP